jgi:serine protease
LATITRPPSPFLAALAAAALLALVPAAGQAQAGAARVIVKLKADSPLLGRAALAVGEPTADRAEALGRRTGLALTAGSAVSDRAQVVFAPGLTSAELAQRLAREADVEYAVPDQRRRRAMAPNDPLYANGIGGTGPAVGQWYLRAPDGAVASAIDVEPAWAVTRGTPGVVVAVVDTGVRFEHPDLLPVAVGGNLLPGYDMIRDLPTANDGSARDADASDPGDWITADEANAPLGPFYECTEYDPDTGRYLAEDSTWHGTQVAGLVAALADNGIGMSGIGPRVHVLPVRVLGKCGGYDSDIIAGMRWAAGLAVSGVPTNPTRAQVVNLSLGSAGPCTAAYRDAVAEITAGGTTIVAAAGNATGHAVFTPANCDGVIAVGGLRHIGTKVGFSNLGPEIALSAPAGNCVNTEVGSPCLYPLLTTSDAGLKTPAGPIYTDSFNPSLGTSFAAPLVAGTAALMLSAQPALAPADVRRILQATVRPFPTAGADDPAVGQCTPPQYDALGKPVDQLQCYCTTAACGAGMLDAGAAVRAASSAVPSTAFQAGGLWWRDPAASESGWGLNLAHQGDVVFATWFTYDTAGRAWWLSMTAARTGSAPESFAGELVETHGPAFNAVPFDPSRVTRRVVGAATLTFPDTNHGTFSYTVNGTQQAKPIVRQAFGTLPTCTYSAQPDFATATNYQDLWWASGGTESGWGINLAHQGDQIFATWFTYDASGAPTWLSATLTPAVVPGGVYSGALIRTAGPPFNAVPFDPAAVTRSVVGTASLAFVTGNAATFSYTVDGVAQSKAIARQLFAPPAGTLCR